MKSARCGEAGYDLEAEIFGGIVGVRENLALCLTQGSCTLLPESISMKLLAGYSGITMHSLIILTHHFCPATLYKGSPSTINTLST